MRTPLEQKLIKILAGKAQRSGAAGYCIDFDPEKFPLELSQIWPGYKRYALEIGCGWGEFSRERAKRETETLFLALEKKLARVRSSYAEQKKENIENLRYLILDLAWFFEGVFALEQFDDITINFPDPWPKKRHHKHRFMSPDFLKTLAAIATPTATLTFATDNYLYAREALRALEEIDSWKNAVGSYRMLPRIHERPQSHFEKIHRGEGAEIYFLCFNASKNEGKRNANIKA